MATNNAINTGKPIEVANGGTGAATFNTYGPVVAASTATGALTSVSPSATSGIPLVSAGAAANPSFTTAVVAGGGTGSTSFNTYGPVVAGATSTTALTSVSPSATSGVALVSQGNAANPAFGTVVVEGGGTGVTTLTGLALGSGTSAFTGVTYVAKTAWTPVLNFGGATTGITYSVQAGLYERIGDLVVASCSIILSNKGSATGAATITGLPLSATAASAFREIIWSSATLDATNSYFVAQLAASASTITLAENISGALTNANFANTTQVIFTLSYYV